MKAACTCLTHYICINRRVSSILFNSTFPVALLSIICSVAAQFALKTGMSAPSVKMALSDGLSARALGTVFLNPYVVAGFGLYGLGAVIWLKVLSQWDVSKAYPLVGLGFVLTMIVGMALGEHFSMPRIVGTLLICTGVWLVASS